MQNYYFPDHVHSCEIDGRLVFLDLRHDAYAALDRDNTALINRIIEGTANCALEDGLPDIVPQMQKAGLLSLGHPTNSESHKAKPAVASRALVEDHITKIKCRYRLAPALVLLACARADGALRWRRIERIVYHVHSRKVRRMPRGQNDMTRAQHLVLSFLRYRPLYPRPYLCLFDSLALIEFLHFYRLYPNWIFGVRLEPFHAHCWVQHGDHVFNEPVDIIRPYTPILAV